MKVKEKLKEILQRHVVPPGSLVVMGNINSLTDELYDDLFMEDFYEDEEFE